MTLRMIDLIDHPNMFLVLGMAGGSIDWKIGRYRRHSNDAL